MGNDYLANGFRRNLFADLWPPLHMGARLGLGAAVGWIVARQLVLRAAGRRWWSEEGAVSALTERRWPCAALFLVAAAALSGAFYTGRVQGMAWPIVHVYLGSAALVAALLNHLARRWRGWAWLDPLLATLWLSAGLSLGALLVLHGGAVVRDGILPRPLGALPADELRAVVAPVVAALALSSFVLLAGLLSATPSPAWPRRPWTRSALRGFAGLPAFLWLGLWASSPLLSRPTLTASNPTNVVFVLIDTLRFDRTALATEGGRGARLTPHLSRLARRGVSFQRALTQAPWTIPACASLLTGLYPWEHEATSYASGLDRSWITLPEILREAGYDTVGIVSNHLVDARRGFAQGFRRYEQRAKGEFSVTGSDLTARALDYLRNPHATPFFLYVHYFDPHFAYVDHEPWTLANAYRGWMTEGYRGMASLRAHRSSFDDEDLDYLRALYDEEVAYADQELGLLLDGIDAAGLSDDTMIVVVSDHGEELFEHGWLGHTTSMHQEVLHVPLLVASPGAPRSREIREPVETRAIFGTILDYLGVAGPTRGARPTLLAEISGAEDVSRSERPVLSQLRTEAGEWDLERNAEQWVVQLGSWKYLFDTLRDREYLFDLSRDPEERTNLAAELPDKLREMRSHLDEWVQDDPGTRKAAPPLAPAEVEQLRALGYAS
jgi:arylsulfatase A-like enzyme